MNRLNQRSIRQRLVDQKLEVELAKEFDDLWLQIGDTSHNGPRTRIDEGTSEISGLSIDWSIDLMVENQKNEMNDYELGIQVLVLSSSNFLSELFPTSAIGWKYKKN